MSSKTKVCRVVSDLLSPTDKELLDLVIQGSDASLAILYERYSHVVFRVALRVCRNYELAEDVLQEVFLQLWRFPERFIAVQGSFAGWMAVVSRNRSIDMLRRSRPMESMENQQFASPENLIRSSENNLMMGKVQESMLLLPAEQQAAMRLSFFDEKTHCQIASEVGCPLGTIKTRIRSGLSSLRKQLTMSGGLI